MKICSPIFWAGLALANVFTDITENSIVDVTEDSSVSVDHSGIRISDDTGDPEKGRWS